MSRRWMRSGVTLEVLWACVILTAGCGTRLTIGQTPEPGEGTNLLSGGEWEYSTDRGQTWTKRSPVIDRGEKATIYARMRFTVAADPARFAALELAHGLPARTRMYFRLNDQPVPVPEKGMYYKVIPAIPATLLKRGTNLLTVKFGYDNRPEPGQHVWERPRVRVALSAYLRGLEAKDLRVTTGPALGAMDAKYFSVICRTNMPAQVAAYPFSGSIARAKALGETPRGLIHRLRLRRSDLGGAEAVAVVADNGRVARVKIVRVPTYPADPGRLRFVAMGDSRTNPRDWALVARAALREKPDLVVFTGDMVAGGRDDWEWDEQFFGPAKRLFAAVPLYPVLGNHEENAPICRKLLYTPGPGGTSSRWSQQIGQTLLVGIDGRQDFSPGSENFRWLERTLAGSNAKFIFLVTHYPAWTSSSHGRLSQKTGRPRERTIRQAQNVIVPLLGRYGATAMLAGHDHTYERSEVPAGPGMVTCITTGGAGAPRYPKSKQAELQNPYSKVYAPVLHYCLFQVNGDTCTMKVVTPAGEVIDTRTWKARTRRSGATPAGASRPGT